LLGRLLLLVTMGVVLVLVRLVLLLW